MLDLAFQPTLPSVCLSCLPPAEYEFEVSSRRPPIRESVDRSDNFHPLFHSIIYTRGGRKVISTTFVYSSMKIDNEETLRSSWNDFSLSLSSASRSSSDRVEFNCNSRSDNGNGGSCKWAFPEDRDKPVRAKCYEPVQQLDKSKRIAR